MRTRRVAVLAVLALVAAPSSVLAQSAGDDQYTNPLPETQTPSSGSGDSTPSGSGGGSTGSGAGTGTGSTAGQTGSSGTQSSTEANTSSGTGSTTSGTDDSGDSLPRTGLPLGILAGLGLLFTFAGRGLRRVSEEPAPDPYASRAPDVPPASPVARAERRRSSRSAS